MEQYKVEFIKFLVESKALKFGDFVTKSGRETPYFINTGLFDTGNKIRKLGDYYAKAIFEYQLDVDVIFGPAYKGIPLSVATSISLSCLFGKDVGYSFNRKEFKDHGERGVIVGRNLKNRVLIIDDVITAGTSIKESLEIFKKYKEIDLVGVIISVDRKEKVDGDKSASEILEDNGVKVYSIVNIEEVVSYLSENKIDGKLYIDSSRFDAIKKYREKYGA